MNIEKPKIITLCGSSKFVDIMAVCAWLLEKNENAIALGLHLLPKWYPNAPADHLAEHENCAEAMDELHLRKIDISSEIFVVNFDQYIGESTAREISYALKHSQNIRWYTHDPIGVAVQKMMLNRCIVELERKRK